MFFLTTMNYEALHWTENNIGDVRCVGLFDTFSDANEIVLGNVCDIHETDYCYVVIEEIKKLGLYPWVDNSYWYEWIDGQYQRIERPIEAKHITNFCLG